MLDPQNDIKKGVIFRHSDGIIYLGCFENGRVTMFNDISDFDGIYEDMELEKIRLVDVSFGANDSFWIKDLMSFEVGGHNEYGEFIPAPVEHMLEDLKFPSDETDNMFGSFLVDIGKAN